MGVGRIILHLRWDYQTKPRDLPSSVFEIAMFDIVSMGAALICHIVFFQITPRADCPPGPTVVSGAEQTNFRMTPDILDPRKRMHTDKKIINGPT